MANESVATDSVGPKNRRQLSFTQKDELGRLENWVPGEGKPDRTHGEACMRGSTRFAEVIQLAAHDDYEAFNAIRFAITSPNWNTMGWGEEDGFAEELAAMALAGIQGVRGGLVNAFNKDLAEKISLENQLDDARERIRELEARASEQAAQ